jgi:hypothetical protein
METYHESAYRCSRTGHTDCSADIRSPRERRADVPGEFIIRIQRLLTSVALGAYGPPWARHPNLRKRPARASRYLASGLPPIAAVNADIRNRRSVAPRINNLS